MNVFVIIAIPILWYSLRNYHKAILWYFLFRLFLSNFVPFLAIEGLPQIRLSFFCDCWFILIPVCLYVRKKGLFVFPKINSSLKPFLWMVLLVLVSSFFSCFPFFNSMTCALLECVSKYIFPLFFFYQIKQASDIKFIITGLMIVTIGAALYGIVEAFVLGYHNPLVLYEQLLNPNITEEMWTYSDLDRGGRGRVSSIFAHAIGCGCTMSIFAVFFLYLKSYFNSYIISKKLFYVATASALLLIGLCNSRSPYPLLFISLLALLKSKSFLKLACVGAVVVIAFQSELASFIDVMLSIFDKSIEQRMGGGSNIEMRKEQFEALFIAWSSGNPVFGEGAYATRFWLEKRIGLLGGESVWISLLLNTGLLGCFLYLDIMKNVVALGQGYGKRMISFFVIGWMIVKTASSTPGLDESLFFMMMFCIVKLDVLSCEMNSVKDK